MSDIDTVVIRIRCSTSREVDAAFIWCSFQKDLWSIHCSRILWGSM